jgi:zinc D-Ala-D-Ala carboxypeptidase
LRFERFCYLFIFSCQLFMKLSKNFNLSELTKSQTAVREGIPNEPNSAQISNLKNLCLNILQPLRDYYGKPVIVSSGYRSPMLNAKTSKSKNSQHLYGLAADFEIPGVANKDVAIWIRQNLVYDQLILEFYNHKDPNSGWIHCSFVNQNRLQSLIFDGHNYLTWS